MKYLTTVLFIVTMGSLWGAVCRADDVLPELPEVQVLKTDDGVTFAILGDKPDAPAPTLFVFGGDMHSALVGVDVNHIGRRLIPHGYLCVSLDVPCHGSDVRPGETPGGLVGWKDRIVNGENLVKSFTNNVSSVLDYLIKEKFSDPEHVAISGTSRGGFMAFHAGAADERVKQVIAFAPVTNLGALTEFKGTETDERVQAHSTIHLADKLVGKPLWIVIGNDDNRVSTDDCLATGREIIKQSKGKLNPVPVEIRLVGTTDHRLHAVPTPQFGQLCAPHEEAAKWLLLQRIVVNP
ncbi:MAG: prolyl oligopeptidase family serine peptidase [Planctomycetota bacterium]|nr:prolyl oligopeptidase family serine peptidase [Planctomycetota bacterium]